MRGCVSAVTTAAAARVMAICAPRSPFAESAELRSASASVASVAGSAAVAACEARAILALGRRLNAVAETVVKTLEHDLHPTQRRKQDYASMLVAARHRVELWPMSDTDFAWASRALGHCELVSATLRLARSNRGLVHSLDARLHRM